MDRETASCESLCIFLSVYLLTFLRIHARDEPWAVSELKRSYHYKKRHFFLQTFPCLLNLLQTILLMKKVCTKLWHIIYSETCIIVLGQLLIRLLILIKFAQAETSFVLSLGWRHKWLFSVDPDKKRIKCYITLILSLNAVWEAQFC